MLVLSRRENETIVFPSINATVQLVQLKGKVARLGVIAPRDVPVVRGELAQHAGAEAAATMAQEEARRKVNHALRNMLNTATVGLGLIRRQVRGGMLNQADATIQTVLEKISTYQHDLEQSPKQKRVHRALLVEDDDNERLLLAGFLRSSGFQVDVAGDGDEALNYLSSSEQPDVVLMDMYMPRCDGPTTVRTIRKDPRHRGLKIFAVSGAAPTRFGLSTGPSGIDRWFQKPLDPERLVGELTRELEIAC